MKHSARLFLSLLVLLSACHKCPAPKTPETVYSTLSPPTCNLPSLPDAPTVTVGFPTPDAVMVSKTDYAQMLAFVDGLADWIVAAEGCLRGQQTFAGELNAFLSGQR